MSKKKTSSKDTELEKEETAETSKSEKQETDTEECKKESEEKKVHKSRMSFGKAIDKLFGD